MATIQIENDQQRVPIREALLTKVGQRILSDSGCPDAELSIVIVDDERIQQINRDYLQRDKPTNVISFAIQEAGQAGVQPQLLGDVVISADTAARDAAEAECPVEHELCFLLLHGTLHLLGYDHERGTEADAERMEAREQELFARILDEFFPG